MYHMGLQAREMTRYQSADGDKCTGEESSIHVGTSSFTVITSYSIHYTKLYDVCVLPMAWVGDHLFSYAQAMVAGFCINCPESGETVMTDLREIGPTYYFAPPRVFENLRTTVLIRMEDAGWIIV